ncbi:unnamed protein product [Amoebophrya sp. A120]|nr:unnamed protein product [Amoebophrya sp. A120]|eukprot:GSA120T00014536001.1
MLGSSPEKQLQFQGAGMLTPSSAGTTATTAQPPWGAAAVTAQARTTSGTYYRGVMPPVSPTSLRGGSCNNFIGGPQLLTFQQPTSSSQQNGAYPSWSSSMYYPSASDNLPHQEQQPLPCASLTQVTSSTVFPPEVTRKYDVVCVLAEGAYAVVCKVVKANAGCGALNNSGGAADDSYTAAAQTGAGPPASKNFRDRKQRRSTMRPVSARGPRDVNWYKNLGGGIVRQDQEPQGRTQVGAREVVLGEKDSHSLSEPVYYAMKVIDERPYQERSMADQLFREISLHEEACSSSSNCSTSSCSIGSGVGAPTTSSKGGDAQAGSTSATTTTTSQSNNLVLKLLEHFTSPSEQDLRHYLVFEYCPNGNLAMLIQRLHSSRSTTIRDRPRGPINTSVLHRTDSASALGTSTSRAAWSRSTAPGPPPPRGAGMNTGTTSSSEQQLLHHAGGGGTTSKLNPFLTNFATSSGKNVAAGAQNTSTGSAAEMVRSTASTSSNEFSASTSSSLLDQVAIEIFESLVDVLNYLHLQKKIVHRDLKPDNILFDRKWRLKVADFGWATTLRDDVVGPYVVNDKCGTLEYMAPEILKQEPQINGQVDVWSIGVVLYQILENCTPFSGYLYRQEQVDTETETVPDEEDGPALLQDHAAVVATGRRPPVEAEHVFDQNSTSSGGDAQQDNSSTTRKRRPTSGEVHLVLDEESFLHAMENRLYKPLDAVDQHAANNTSNCGSATDVGSTAPVGPPGTTSTSPACSIIPGGGGGPNKQQTLTLCLQPSPFTRCTTENLAKKSEWLYEYVKEQKEILRLVKQGVSGVKRVRAILKFVTSVGTSSSACAIAGNGRNYQMLTPTSKIATGGNNFFGAPAPLGGGLATSRGPPGRALQQQRSANFFPMVNNNPGGGASSGSTTTSGCGMNFGYRTSSCIASTAPTPSNGKDKNSNVVHHDQHQLQRANTVDMYCSTRQAGGPPGATSTCTEGGERGGGHQLHLQQINHATNPNNRLNQTINLAELADPATLFPRSSSALRAGAALKMVAPASPRRGGAGDLQGRSNYMFAAPGGEDRGDAELHTAPGGGRPGVQLEGGVQAALATTTTAAGDEQEHKTAGGQHQNRPAAGAPPVVVGLQPLKALNFINKGGGGATATGAGPRGGETREAGAGTTSTATTSGTATPSSAATVQYKPKPRRFSLIGL